MKWPAGMWQRAVQTRFSKTVRVEAAMRASSLSIVEDAGDRMVSEGMIFVTLSGGLASEERSADLRLTAMLS